MYVLYTRTCTLKVSCARSSLSLPARWTLPAGRHILVCRTDVAPSVGSTIADEIPAEAVQQWGFIRTRLMKIKAAMDVSTADGEASYPVATKVELETLDAAPEEPAGLLRGSTPAVLAARQKRPRDGSRKRPLSVTRGGDADQSSPDRRASQASGSHVQMITPLDSSLKKHLLQFRNMRSKYLGSPESRLSQELGLLHSCIDKQKDVVLVNFDFVVELVEGQPFHGLAHFVEHGQPLPTTCRGCGGASILRLLRNSTETEKCILRRKSFEGVLSSCCDACLKRLHQAKEAETRALRDRPDFLSEEERQRAVVLRLPSDDFERHMQAYRLYKWMRDRGIKVAKMRTLDGQLSPHFVLEGRSDLYLLEREMTDVRKGQLEKPHPSVCVPHFKHRLDESLCTMNGTRRFMQNCEAQKFACVHGLTANLLVCLRERMVQYVTSASEEALVGSCKKK